MTLKSLLQKIEQELKRRDEIREEVQKDMRRATRLSKQSILFMHQERFEEAKELLNEASELLLKLRKISKTHPDLVYTGVVNAAHEEFAEARALLALITEKRFPNRKDIGVPAISYVLGLGDVIGELRRRTLDALRKGDVKLAEDSLELMEEIYIELMCLDDAFLIVPGLRRKCDIARKIIESTRGDVTIENRRSSLEKSIQELKGALVRKRKAGKT